MNKSIVMDITSTGFTSTMVVDGKADTVSLGFGPGLQELIGLFIEGVRKERAADAAEEAENKVLRDLNHEISLARAREALARQMMSTLEAEGQLKKMKEGASADDNELRQRKAAFEEAARKRAQQQNK